MGMSCDLGKGKKKLSGTIFWKPGRIRGVIEDLKLRKQNMKHMLS